VGTRSVKSLTFRTTDISIQLVSPASGDCMNYRYYEINVCDFHSISFPSEWGLRAKSLQHLPHCHFHSISFPSEWGPQSRQQPQRSCLRISIQLVSPASGDLESENKLALGTLVISIQLVSPASGDPVGNLLGKLGKRFPFN